MNRRVYLSAALLGVATVSMVGCGSTNARKQKFLESGNRYSADHKYKEAEIEYLNALKLDKNFVEAHYALAMAYEQMDEFGPAYGEFHRAVDLQPANYKARIELGRLLLASGRVEEAQEQADVVTKAEPDNPDACTLLSAIALRQGQKDYALIELNRALRLDPKRAQFHEDLAMLLSGDPSQASTVEQELKNAVVLDPKSVSFKLSLASYYARQNRLQEAEKISWDAVATDPKSLAAREGVANVILREGDQPRTEQVLRQAEKDLVADPKGVAVLADYYVASGQWDKARAEFATIVANHPKDVSVAKSYTRVLLEQKDYAAAQTVVAHLLKLSPKDPEVAGLNGIVLLNSGKATEAVAALQSAVKDFPKDAFLQSWLGRAQLAKGNVDSAESSLRQAVTQSPTRLDAQAELAQIALQRGDMNLLADVAGKSIVAAPRFPGGYVWRAMTEVSRNAPDQAEADLKTAISLAPKNSVAYLTLGRLRFSQKRFPEGVTLLEQALEYDPESYDALRLLVSYDLYLKQPDKAVTRVNAQIEKSGKNSRFYDLLAQLQMQNKNLDLASAAAEKAVQLNSNDGAAVNLYARIELQRGKIASAVATWQQWSIAHPNDAGSIAVLGSLEEAAGDRAKAEADYKKALEMQPKQPLAANNLAYLMLQNGGNVDVALTLAQTARQGLENTPQTADTLAWAYYYKGTFAFARDLLEDATKTEPNDATMQYHLGMVYSKLDDKDNAKLHLRKAVTLDPDSSVAKDAKAALQGLG